MNSTPDKKYQPPISEDLARTHVFKFMTDKINSVSPTTSLKTAIHTMLNKQISALPVVDSQNKCLGVFSEFDAMLQGASDSLDSPIKYSKSPITVSEETSFRDALILLISKRIKRLLVVDHKGHLRGIVSRRDFMKAIFSDQK